MSGLKPEERAREWIDRKLEDAGWQVINRDEYSPGMTAVAVREAAMRGGLEADYLLLINGKAAAVLEAKREEITLDNPHLIAQAENYTKQVQPWYPTWELPLPFVYLSNGKEIAFKDCRQVDAKYEIVQKFMRPWDLVRQLNLGEFDGLPYLSPEGLRACQVLPNPPEQREPFPKAARFRLLPMCFDCDLTLDAFDVEVEKFGHTRRLASEKLMPCIRSYPSGSEDSGPCRYGRPRVMR